MFAAWDTTFALLLNLVGVNCKFAQAARIENSNYLSRRFIYQIKQVYLAYVIKEGSKILKTKLFENSTIERMKRRMNG